MRQIVVIHGGTTFANYDKYIEFLSSKPLRIDRFTYKPMWKELLQEKLGDTYQVLLPSMPNKTNAKYSEWAIWFKNLENIIDDDCILIGHSLGAIFLAKYLSEHAFSHRIKATILIAAPFDNEVGEDLTDFKLDGLSDMFTSQAGKTVLFFGSNDPVVPFSEIEKYKHELPDAEFNIVPAPDHFVRVDFPELADVLREI